MLFCCELKWSLSLTPAELSLYSPYLSHKNNIVWKIDTSQNIKMIKNNLIILNVNAISLKWYEIDAKYN